MLSFKYFIASSFMLLVSTGAHAAGTLITCDFAKADFGLARNIKKIEIQSGTPGVLSVFYQVGSQEALRPQAGMGGTFDEIQFPASIEESGFVRTHLVQAISPRLGLIQLTHTCETPSSFYCVTRSAGDTGLERVRFNIDGAKLIFDGNSLPHCQRDRT